MAVSNLDDFQALDPFFRIIEEGVAGLVDGEHFFDLLAEDVVFEYIITVPGYPRRVAERQAVAELYRPYGATIVLDRCYDLAVHHDQVTGVVVLEYASQGRVVRPGLPTATATSRCCRSSTARSLTGATTSIRSRSLTRSAGPPPQTATDLSRADRVVSRDCPSATRVGYRRLEPVGSTGEGWSIYGANPQPVATHGMVRRGRRFESVRGLSSL